MVVQAEVLAELVQARTSAPSAGKLTMVPMNGGHALTKTTKVSKSAVKDIGRFIQKSTEDHLFKRSKLKAQTGAQTFIPLE